MTVGSKWRHLNGDLLFFKRTIVNAVVNVLAQFVGLDASAEQAIAAPRTHTEGNLDLTVEAATPGADVDYLKDIGYMVKQGFVANANALWFNPETRAARA